MQDRSQILDLLERALPPTGWMACDLYLTRSSSPIGFRSISQLTTVDGQRVVEHSCGRLLMQTLVHYQYVPKLYR